MLGGEPQMNKDTSFEFINRIKTQLDSFKEKNRNIPTNNTELKSLESMINELDEFTDNWRVKERQRITTEKSAKNEPFDAKDLEEYLNMHTGEIKFTIRHIRECIEAIKGSGKDRPIGWSPEADWGGILQGIFNLEWELKDNKLV